MIGPLLLCQSGWREIGHFRVPPGLCFTTRVGAQPLIWKSLFILMQMKLIFTRKAVHLASFWKWGLLELGLFETAHFQWFVKSAGAHYKGTGTASQTLLTRVRFHQGCRLQVFPPQQQQNIFCTTILTSSWESFKLGHPMCIITGSSLDREKT